MIDKSGKEALKFTVSLAKNTLPQLATEATSLVIILKEGFM